MLRIYFDLETSDLINERVPGGESIIAIGLLVEEKNASPYSVIYSEWDMGSEAEVIRSFYNFLEERVRSSKFVEVVGFNILRLDVPLLVMRAVKLRVKSLEEAFAPWRIARTADLRQILLSFNGMRYKGLSLESMLEKLRRICGIEELQLHGSGRNVPQWYKNREFKEIEKHLIADLEATRALYKCLVRCLAPTVSRLLSESGRSRCGPSRKS